MRAYIPNCENDYRFPEDMERILNYLNANGQLNIKPQRVEELYEAYSEDVWCAGKYNQSMLDARGKNCIHAHAGRQLLNDEIVFYHEDSICLNYIVKFK